MLTAPQLPILTATPSILAVDRRARSFSMFSETMRPPTYIFSAMLLGAVALLLGLVIGVMISELLPDTIPILTDLGRAAREVAN